MLCMFFIFHRVTVFHKLHESTENKQLPFSNNVIERNGFNSTKLIIITVNSDVTPPISLRQTVGLQPL